MKRVFSFLLVLLLVVGLVPVQARAISLEDILVMPWLNGEYADSIYVQHSIFGDTVTLTCDGYSITGGTLHSGDGDNLIGSFKGSSFLFPANYPSVTVRVSLTPSSNAVYEITTSSDENGTVTAERANAAQGDTVKVAVEPKEGYELDKLTITGPDGAEITPNADYSFTMPAGDVTIMATFKVDTTEYTVTVDSKIDSQQGTVTADRTQAKRGETVKVTVTPEADYALDKLTITGPDGEITPNTDGTFTMPKGNVTIMATFKRLYPIKIADTENGTLAVTLNSASVDKAAEGDVVTITATPVTSASGEKFILDTITVTKDGSEETVNVREDNTFIMPGCGVTVSATFRKAVVITFDYNEGTNVDNVASVIIPAGNSLSALPNTARADHKLVGWYLPNGTKVDVETSFADDTTITARWVYAKHTTKQQGNDFEADLAMENADVLDQLLDDEDLSTALKDGLNVYVFMEVAKKSEESVPSADKTAITSKVGSNKIAAYLDITLWKQIGEDRNVAKKITNTGDAVPITMKLDAGIIPANAGSVYIVYYHGEAKEIRNVSYNHATRELTFPASEFSTYSLVYTPYVAPAAAPASSNTYVLDNVPKTGEGSALMNWTLLVLCSAAMLAAVAVFDKKRAR